MEEKIIKLLKKLKESKRILLINHIRMDADALGSLGALYLILKENGYDVKATNDEKLHENFKFLIDFDFFEPGLDIKKYDPDLIISLDAASFGQLGETYKNHKSVFDDKFFVVIDHHITNEGFGDLNIIDNKSSSTCELMYEIIDELGFLKYIDKKIASLLITGILYDTGIYFNLNSSSKTLKIASKLLDLGADSRTSIFNLFKKKTINKTRLWGEALKDLKISQNGKIVWGIITREMFKKTNSTDNDISGLINEFLLNMDGTKVGFLLFELEKGGVKASFRSTIINVGKFCGTFPGGGGHKQAAGFTVFEDINIIEKNILEKLKQYI